MTIRSIGLMNVWWGMEMAVGLLYLTEMAVNPTFSDANTSLCHISSSPYQVPHADYEGWRTAYMIH